MTVPAIVVHGGAGAWSDDRLEAAKVYVRAAALRAWEVLRAGGTAVDAAEACTMYLESCGGVNAGVGARRNLDGMQELDAMIIDGTALSFGAVAAVTNMYNPICIARYVMDKTPHSFFAGPGAERLYYEMVNNDYRQEVVPGIIKRPDIGPPPSGDTVGCVVVDSEGRVAATSSTGGTAKKMPGRVGDSPVFGAGAYADELCGVSATGRGEDIMRVTLSRTVALFVQQGEPVSDAASHGLEVLLEKTDSRAGVIVIDRDGEVGWATTTKAMPVAAVDATGKVTVSDR